MKNIIDLLSDAGVEIPEDKKEAFNTAFSENYKTIAEADKLRTARDNYKNQLETAQNALKGFEGVNVDDLNGKITQLTADLAAKEKDYQTKIEAMEFDSILNTAISGAKAKNAKAVRALLDVDALMESKNRSEDIKAAIDKVKSENDYLFDGTNVPGGGGNPSQSSQKMSLTEAMAYKNLHPDADVSTLI